MKIGVDALTSTSGKQFEYGNTANTFCKVYWVHILNNLCWSCGFSLDIAGGTTLDYYFENENVFYSFVIELRDKTLIDFDLPPNQILPAAIETWNGIKALVKAI